MAISPEFALEHSRMRQEDAEKLDNLIGLTAFLGSYNVDTSNLNLVQAFELTDSLEYVADSKQYHLLLKSDQSVKSKFVFYERESDRPDEKLVIHFDQISSTHKENKGSMSWINSFGTFIDTENEVREGFFLQTNTHKLRIEGDNQGRVEVIYTTKKAREEMEGLLAATKSMR